MKKEKKKYCIDGTNLASAIRVLKGVFEDSVISVDINHENGNFDIILKDDVEKKSIDKLLKQYPLFNITIAVLNSYK